MKSILIKDTIREERIRIVHQALWGACGIDCEFCKALNMIKEQDETNQKFSDALQLVGDGYFAFGSDNQYLIALLMVMKEAVDDKYDYIDWWLYDATEDHRVWTEDDSKEWNLTDPAALYDFIKAECH